MRSIMVSIKPYWCEMILSGEKTMEIRKTLPNMGEPFKAYIYATKSNSDWRKLCQDGMIQLSGRIVGEFVCYEFDRFFWREQSAFAGEIRKKAALTIKDLRAYAGDDESLYAWHISELREFDEPFDVADFLDNNGDIMKRPPQSWQYVIPRF